VKMTDEIELILRDFSKDQPRMGLSSRGNLYNYVRFADEVSRYVPEGKVLDWGCGAGQMSWLLSRRGLDVVAYDVQEKAGALRGTAQFVKGDDPTTLPLPDTSFDAVLSSGVLEHVPDERGSLREVWRVLRLGGYFFVYQLPQIYSYTEAINRLLGHWYHQRRYTMRSAVRLLEEANFRVIVCHRANFFPKNLTGLPVWAWAAYNRLAPTVEQLDRLFSRLSVVNLLCHSLELIARKEDELGGQGANTHPLR
jgi:ubiquinone/menaquinone biosynthesis C-methylase UbiE